MTGRLTGGDCTLDTGQLVDYFELIGAAGQIIEVTLRPISPSFTSPLVVLVPPVGDGSKTPHRQRRRREDLVPVVEHRRVADRRELARRGGVGRLRRSKQGDTISAEMTSSAFEPIMGICDADGTLLQSSFVSGSRATLSYFVMRDGEHDHDAAGHSRSHVRRERRESVRHVDQRSVHGLAGQAAAAPRDPKVS